MPAVSLTPTVPWQSASSLRGEGNPPGRPVPVGREQLWHALRPVELPVPLLVAGPAICQLSLSVPRLLVILGAPRHFTGLGLVAASAPHGVAAFPAELVQHVHQQARPHASKIMVDLAVAAHLTVREHAETRGPTCPEGRPEGLRGRLGHAGPPERLIRRDGRAAGPPQQGQLRRRTRERGPRQSQRRLRSVGVAAVAAAQLAAHAGEGEVVCAAGLTGAPLAEVRQSIMQSCAAQVILGIWLSLAPQQEHCQLAAAKHAGVVQRLPAFAVHCVDRHASCQH
mmetsp:Transcript_139946/g.390148  ORF Transcript_139946/g.390148 Transcript_139946/m.390148 type:complete len:282 (-) Transcript_139946:688-1533(-)